MSRARGVYLFETVLVYLPAPLLILFFAARPDMQSLLWAAGTAAVVVLYRVFLFQRATRAADASPELRRPRFFGELIAPVLQILWLVLLVPPGAVVLWSGAVLIVYLLLPAVADPRRPYVSHAGLLLVLLCAALLLMPPLPTTDSLPALAGCLLPAVTTDPALPCLPIERGADWMLFQVFLLVLFRPRRYALSVLVWLLIGVVAARFLTVMELPGLLALTALPFFFPGRPYRLLVPRVAFALPWAVVTAVLAYVVGPAGAFFHTAWILGLLAAMLVSAGCESFLTTRRFS